MTQVVTVDEAPTSWLSATAVAGVNTPSIAAGHTAFMVMNYGDEAVSASAPAAPAVADWGLVASGVAPGSPINRLAVYQRTAGASPVAAGTTNATFTSAVRGHAYAASYNASAASAVILTTQAWGLPKVYASLAATPDSKQITAVGTGEWPRVSTTMTGLTGEFNALLYTASKGNHLGVQSRDVSAATAVANLTLDIDDQVVLLNLILLPLVQTVISVTENMSAPDVIGAQQTGVSTSVSDAVASASSDNTDADAAFSLSDSTTVVDSVSTVDAPSVTDPMTLADYANSSVDGGNSVADSASPSDAATGAGGKGAQVTESLSAGTSVVTDDVAARESIAEPITADDAPAPSLASSVSVVDVAHALDATRDDTPTAKHESLFDVVYVSDSATDRINSETLTGDGPFGHPVRTPRRRQPSTSPRAWMIVNGERVSGTVSELQDIVNDMAKHDAGGVTANSNTKSKAKAFRAAKDMRERMEVEAVQLPNLPNINIKELQLRDHLASELQRSYQRSYANHLIAARRNAELIERNNEIARNAAVKLLMG